MVDNVKSNPLPCNVILPLPTIGAVFKSVPPPMISVPPVPGDVFNKPLTINAVALFGFSLVALIAPPAV